MGWGRRARAVGRTFLDDYILGTFILAAVSTAAMVVNTSWTCTSEYTVKVEKSGAEPSALAFCTQMMPSATRDAILQSTASCAIMFQMASLQSFLGAAGVSEDPDGRGGDCIQDLKGLNFVLKPTHWARTVNLLGGKISCYVALVDHIYNHTRTVELCAFGVFVIGCLIYGVCFYVCFSVIWNFICDKLHVIKTGWQKWCVDVGFLNQA